MSIPPFMEHYRAIFVDAIVAQQRHCQYDQVAENIEACDLPLINLLRLRSGEEEERRACMKAMGNASSQWGFFQVLNHGISSELLREMRKEQRKLFKIPFEKKVTSGMLNDSYRWGTPTAISMQQFSWSEAFHVPLSKISEDKCRCGELRSLREVMEKIAAAMSELVHTIASILAENLGFSGHCFLENCSKSTCFLRLNRYPPCPFSPETFGLMPHTDSDFLTILYQDQVGGLQLMKDSLLLF